MKANPSESFSPLHLYSWAAANSGIAQTAATGVVSDPSGAVVNGANVTPEDMQIASRLDGYGHPLWGLPFWNLDSSLGGRIALTESMALDFSFDFYNMFNHPNYSTPSLSLTGSEVNFGVITSTVTPANRRSSAHWIMFGADGILAEEGEQGHEIIWVANSSSVDGSGGAAAVHAIGAGTSDRAEGAHGL